MTISMQQLQVENANNSQPNPNMGSLVILKKKVHN